MSGERRSGGVPVIRVAAGYDRPAELFSAGRMTIR